MAKRLPLSDTSVSVNKSIAQIMDHLEKAGFESIGQMKKGAEHIVIAEYKNAKFIWKANVENITKALIESKGESVQTDIRRGWGRGPRMLKNIQEQAPKTAWRILADHVDQCCIAVHYGAIEFKDAFIGNVLLPGNTTIGDYVVSAIESGTLQSGEFNLPLLLEEKK
jgi:hypothetical protein